MRNTKAFETAVADTLAELAKRGVTARPGTVAASSKKNITAVSSQLRTQVRST